ncbi:MAG: bifunctional phosphoribosylaminoimidazolecarboxamide formyltransferase/IMP cyclohydrolase [Candidatus Eisenbacteria bacterium]|uniref:Bifunctional purine biosynthesis protein PurH n=1 Tax=Eiseniibacteriota bacterium TaxID=2212470 RepID=A0A9D6L8L0_UNCEI|nr:bifunctional phosphoribosylaminoimidazolecarboxamide formyltransferase/IMP cyclohydrolase [Candidatus Eisenbacteria bacterium]MBI3538915.1 bifunctional phosphoribosylaminoimidazolecarboxamide formyltransferase/IMP cyclohydrolase [Candidatus Eisenbacteria bacterium]
MSAPRDATATARGGGDAHGVRAWPAAALLSLSDKTGAAEFARALAAHGTRILASGGTAAHLGEAGIAVTTVEEWTASPEMLGGRVKTLHPNVHGPILARRSVASDMATLAAQGIGPIDLVAVTLYPFEERAGGLDESGAVDEIDIGGVALLRGAAKNYADVIVIHDPLQYGAVLAALEGGGTRLEQRREWALATFARTARYDAAIAAELARRATGDVETPEPPLVHALVLERARGLRYGENPHQSAALYTRAGDSRALQALREGKELSYNNLLDVEAAVLLAWRFWAPACVIVKHNQPCGVATAAHLRDAYEAALASDEQSAYGGIVAFNRPLDGETAHRLAQQFVECVAAPEFSSDAEAALASKKNLRLLRLAQEDVAASDSWEIRLAGRWALLQYEPKTPAPEWKTVTRRAPSDAEMEAMRFAWEVVAAARSNAIAIARGTALIGLGSGQTSRVDAVDVALMKARRAGHALEGAVLASDGFFPFADNIEHAAAAGIGAIVQPGGSMRDAEVIAACDRHGMAMVFTDRRVFRH